MQPKLCPLCERFTEVVLCHQICTYAAPFQQRQIFATEPFNLFGTSKYTELFDHDANVLCNLFIGSELFNMRIDHPEMFLDIVFTCSTLQTLNITSLNL
jgi:hypothetical protein